MKMKRYPLERAIELARQVVGYCGARYREILEDAQFHDLWFVTCLARRLGARFLVRRVPGASREAAIMDVLGNPFIIVDPDVSRDRNLATRVIAHETAHLMLGHLERPSFAFGFSGTMDRFGELAQRCMKKETELEAELLGMILILPDSYLHAIVEDSVFIPTVPLSKEHGLDLDFVRTRITLYRRMHGYKRSKHLLREGDKYNFGQADVDKWFLPDLCAQDQLIHILPYIDQQMYEFLERRRLRS